MTTKKSGKKKDMSEIRLGKGSAMSSRNQCMSDAEIESWIKAVRAAYAAGTLPAYKIARIERIPGWTWTDQASE